MDDRGGIKARLFGDVLDIRLRKETGRGPGQHGALEAGLDGLGKAWHNVCLQRNKLQGVYRMIVQEERSLLFSVQLSSIAECLSGLESIKILGYVQL